MLAWQREPGAGAGEEEEEHRDPRGSMEADPDDDAQVGASPARPAPH